MFLASATARLAASDATNSVRVYHVGNSVTDTIRYGALEKLAETRGLKITWGRHMIPDAPLEWLYGHPNDGFRESPFGGWSNALTQFAWDAVSFQPSAVRCHASTTTLRSSL